MVMVGARELALTIGQKRQTRADLCIEPVVRGISLQKYKILYEIIRRFH